MKISLYLSQKGITKEVNIFTITVLAEETVNYFLEQIKQETLVENIGCKSRIFLGKTELLLSRAICKASSSSYFRNTLSFSQTAN